jgi:DNA/RNA-binding domain of Phe-tRNA-synthetase-like protein
MKQELAIRRGWVDPPLHAEFPGLALMGTEVAAPGRRSPRELRQRLRYLSDRVHGQHALSIRREPIASAYRVFFRQIGIDPDVHRPPGEAAMLERMKAGWFRSRNIVDDALTVAVVETGVAVRAFDAALLQGDLGLRISQPDERLGGGSGGLLLPDGTIGIADERAIVGLVFGDTSERHGVTGDTERIALCAVRVEGVPDICVEEALWTSADILDPAS